MSDNAQENAALAALKRAKLRSQEVIGVWKGQLDEDAKQRREVEASIAIEQAGLAEIEAALAVLEAKNG